MVTVSDGCGGEHSDMDKVSAVSTVFNLCDTQNVRGKMSYVRGDTGGELVSSGPGEGSVRQHDDGGGQEQGDRDVGCAVYSSVQWIGDEKGVAGQGWSMKSGRLP